MVTPPAFVIGFAVQAFFIVLLLILMFLPQTKKYYQLWLIILIMVILSTIANLWFTVPTIDYQSFFIIGLGIQVALTLILLIGWLVVPKDFKYRRLILVLFIVMLVGLIFLGASYVWQLSQGWFG